LTLKVGYPFKRTR